MVMTEKQIEAMLAKGSEVKGLRSEEFTYERSDFQIIYEMMGKLPRQTMKSKIEFCEDSSSDFLFHFELYTCLHGGKVFYLFDEQGALKAIGGEG